MSCTINLSVFFEISYTIHTYQTIHCTNSCSFDVLERIEVHTTRPTQTKNQSPFAIINGLAINGQIGLYSHLADLSTSFVLFVTVMVIQGVSHGRWGEALVVVVVFHCDCFADEKEMQHQSSSTNITLRVQIKLNARIWTSSYFIDILWRCILLHWLNEKG